MSSAPETDLILGLLCSKLVDRASSGAIEIGNILNDRGTELHTTGLQELSGLSTKLHELELEAAQLQDALHSATVISPAVRSSISAQLPECDTAAAIMIKQLMRIGSETPREQISVPTIAQYDFFLESLVKWTSFSTRLMRLDSVESQEAILMGENGTRIVSRVTRVCQDIKESKGILLDPEMSTRATGQSVSKQRTSDLPPAYEAPPPFENSLDTVWTSPNTATGGSVNGEEQTEGFFSSFMSPFKAAAAALRPKPEPFVVPLCQAATVCNIPQMNFLLKQGANINGRNEDGQTPLICAVLAHQVEAARFLLEAGADLGTRDSGRNAKPPLFHAVDAEDRAIVDLLFKHGAQANQREDWVNMVTGQTPIEWIEVLLQHGADAGAQDMSGRKIIIKVLTTRKNTEDREQVVNLLLQHGASPNAKDITGTSLLFIAAEQKRDALVHRLLELGADANCRDTSGTTALVMAVKRHDYALAKTLLEHGADPNKPDIVGTHMIIHVLNDRKADAADRQAMLELLFAHGARADKKDLYGTTVLEHSVTTSASPSIRIPELMLRNGADPNQRLKKVADEPTLLTHALRKGQWDLARLALECGANANLVDKSGRSPLLLAILAGNESLVKVLLKHGADVKQTCQVSPLELATAQISPDIVRLLTGSGKV
ncbi:ankyrin repeat-containing domain protein [Xylariaceae sp. FL1019]|nr:ankyrin repeat-containing domain protein [Xylariaceae sp. FL1019]